jgi:undecaprenyl-diphosphatase
MKKKLKFLGISILLFVLFLLLSYVVAREHLVKFDFNTTVRLQDNISRSYDSVFSSFSLIGSAEIISILLIVVIVLLRKFKGVLIFLPYAILHVIELFGKTIIDQTKPAFFMIRTSLPVEFPTFYVQTGYSYPSGHSARTAFLAVLVAFIIYRSKKLSKNAKIVSYSLIGVFCLAMFLSRIYLGEHWATDVIGGALLGASLSFLSLVLI